jgi:hypothetical protein
MANQSGGMSKGCIIALIITGAILLIVIIAGITCYVYREDIAKGTAGVIVNGVKKQLAEKPIEGVDTVKFDAIADTFLDKLDKTKLDPEKFRDFMVSAQQVASTKALSAADVSKLVDAMVLYFPDLKEMASPVAPAEPAEPQDSTIMEDSVPM